jgi:hypothetical protein
MRAIKWVVCIIVLVAPCVYADQIYRWTDKSGVVHFGSTPPDGLYINNGEEQVVANGVIQTSKRAGNDMAKIYLPPETTAYAIIKQKAEKDWPDSYRMRNHSIKSQTEAYMNLKKMGYYRDLPVEVMEKIWKKASADWPDNFTMMEHSVKSEIAEYIKWVRHSVEIKK